MIQETRTRLLRAGRAAFAQLGFAKTSMDELTASVGLTRGALYHHFGDKRGLFQAVVDQMDTEMALAAKKSASGAHTQWEQLLAEGAAYIEMALQPDVQRIVLLDGPAVLGDPSRWPSQHGCLQSTSQAIERLISDGVVAPVAPEAAARLLNGAALNAALWVAAEAEPLAVLPAAVSAFQRLARGLLSINRDS